MFQPSDLDDCDDVFHLPSSSSSSSSSSMSRQQNRGARSSLRSFASSSSMGGGRHDHNNSNDQESEESKESIKHMGPMLTDASLMKSHVIRGSSVSARGSGNPSMEESATFSSSGVREAFVQFFVSLLSCYRHCYVVDDHPEDPAPMGKFKVIDNQIWDKKQFVHEQSRSYQAGRDSRDFLSLILETQLFEDFVRTHTPREDAPTEICLFDEYVVLFRGTLQL